MKRKKQTTKQLDFHGQPFPVIVQKDAKKGYWVSCPVISGCYSQGETIDEALKNIREAIELCLDMSDALHQKAAVQSASLHFVAV